MQFRDQGHARERRGLDLVAAAAGPLAASGASGGDARLIGIEFPEVTLPFRQAEFESNAREFVPKAIKLELGRLRLHYDPSPENQK